MSVQTHQGLIFSSFLKPFAVSHYFFLFERTKRGKQDQRTTEALIAFLSQSEAERNFFFLLFKSTKPN